MQRLYRIAMIVFVQILYALTIGGTIIALYCDQLVIALLCAGASSLLHPFWRHIESKTSHDEGDA